jgi:hypothetical protein
MKRISLPAKRGLLGSFVFSVMPITFMYRDRDVLFACAFSLPIAGS